MGMQHALEADHIAAVASLTSGEMSSRRAIVHGATWGLGHTLSLLIFGGAVLLFGLQLSEQLSQWLELAVGAMLVWLGTRVLYRVWCERLHIHMHGHADGTVHMHAHGHHGGQEKPRHDHLHQRISPGAYLQTLTIGIMHGMAGTAALLVFVAAAAVDTVSQGIGYISIFGLGSVLGMAMLSVVIVCPAALVSRSLPNFGRSLRVIVGLGTSAMGGFVLVAYWVQ